MPLHLVQQSSAPILSCCASRLGSRRVYSSPGWMRVFPVFARNCYKENSCDQGTPHSSDVEFVAEIYPCRLFIQVSSHRCAEFLMFMRRPGLSLTSQ